MKSIISVNEFYKIVVDTQKNRLYITLIGYWNSPKLVPFYLEDLTRAMQFLGKDFSCMADFSGLRKFSQEVRQQIHHKAMRRLLEGGLKFSAQVMPNSAFASQQIKDLEKEFGVRLAPFGDQTIAELYLDGRSQAAKMKST